MRAHSKRPHIQRVFEQQKPYADIWLCGVISAAMLVLLLLYAGKKSFFSDEMDQLGILVSCKSLSELLSLYARMEHEVAPPLFASAGFLWNRLMPLSQRWLQTLPAIAACIGVFFIGLSGRLLGGKRTAVLSSLLACSLPTMATTVGTQFRQYGFVFLFAALTVYAYLLRAKHQGKETARSIVFYGVVMAGLPYSHYLSVYVCLFLFTADVVLFCKKRIRFACVWSYVLGAALFLPWAATIFQSVIGISSFWIPQPRISDVRDALYFLTDAFSVRFFLYVGGLCTALVALLSRRAGSDAFGKRYTAAVFALAAPLLIVLLFVYSKWPGNGVSLFLPRYCICTLPMVILTCGLFFSRISRLIPIPRYSDAATIATSFLLICTILFGVSAWQNVQANASEVYEPYKEAANWLAAQPDIYDADTAVVTAGESRYVTAGWEALYVTQSGRRPSYAIFDRVRPFTENDVQQYKTVYVMRIHASLAQESTNTLNARYVLDVEADDGVCWNVTRLYRQD